MKSYKEYSKGRLSEAVTINDNIWAYLNKEIDGLFDKLKNDVKNTIVPRSEWMKNIHKRLFDLQYGKNESDNYRRLHFSLFEYKTINGLLDEMSSALREADMGGDSEHIDGLVDLYKEKFKEIIKNLFARIKVNHKTPRAAGTTGATPTASPLAPKPATSPLVPPKAETPPEVTKPLQEPGEDIPEPAITSPMKPVVAPKITPPAKPPIAPSHEPTTHVPPDMGRKAEPAVHDPVDDDDLYKKDHEKEVDQENKLVKLGMVSNYMMLGWEKDAAFAAAEKSFAQVAPDERDDYIRLGQIYQDKEEEGKVPATAKAAMGLEAPKEAPQSPAQEKDELKDELLARYNSGPKGQRSIRRMIKKFAPELVIGSNIKKHNVIPIIDAYLKKKRAHAGLPPAGGIKEMVEHYRELLRNPNRTISLLEEAEKIDSIRDRVGFYKQKLRLSTS